MILKMALVTFLLLGPAFSSPRGKDKSDPKTINSSIFDTDSDEANPNSDDNSDPKSYSGMKDIDSDDISDPKTNSDDNISDPKTNSGVITKNYKINTDSEETNGDSVDDDATTTTTQASEFEAFYPREAYGIPNSVVRAPHGHGSFYKYRNPALVDTKNAPAYGFRFDGKRRFNYD